MAVATVAVARAVGRMVEERMVVRTAMEIAVAMLAMVMAVVAVAVVVVVEEMAEVVMVEAVKAVAMRYLESCMRPCVHLHKMVIAEILMNAPPKSLTYCPAQVAEGSERAGTKVPSRLPRVRCDQRVREGLVKSISLAGVVGFGRFLGRCLRRAQGGSGTLIGARSRPDRASLRLGPDGGPILDCRECDATRELTVTDTMTRRLACKLK